MGLNHEQMDKIHHLKRGEAIIRTGLGYTKPILVNIFDFPEQELSDRELAQIMTPAWNKLLEGIEPARHEDQQLSLPAVRKIRTDSKSEKAIDGSHAGAPEKTMSTSSGELSANEQNYLRIVKSHPYRLVTEVYNLLGDEVVMGTETMSQATAVKVRKQLLKKGLLEDHAVKGTGKSGRSYFDVVTDKANMGKTKHPRGDPLHSFWCYRIAEKFRRIGATVRMGETISGHEVDIGVEIDG